MPKDTQFYLSAIDNLADPSRKTRWRMILPGSILGKYSNTNKADLFKNSESQMDDFALHIKQCKIPDMTVTQQAHNYMGFKSNYVVNAKLDADFTFQAILLEDARAYEALLAWQQGSINTGVLRKQGKDAFTSESLIPLGLGHHKDSPDAKNLVVRNTIAKCEM